MPAWASRCSHPASAAPAASAALRFPACAPAVAAASVQFAAAGREPIAAGLQPRSPHSLAASPRRLPPSTRLPPGRFAAERTSTPPASEVEKVPQICWLRDAVSYQQVLGTRRALFPRSVRLQQSGRTRRLERAARGRRQRRTPGPPARVPGPGWSTVAQALLRAL